MEPGTDRHVANRNHSALCAFVVRFNTHGIVFGESVEMIFA